MPDARYMQPMMSASTAERVRKRRPALRASGLRPWQIWVPDTRQPGFVEECRRQARRVGRADAADRNLLAFIEAAWADLDKSVK
jgi:hypothetical protein